MATLQEMVIGLLLCLASLTGETHEFDWVVSMNHSAYWKELVEQFYNKRDGVTGTF
jgi:hypothetical protein